MTAVKRIDDEAVQVAAVIAAMLEDKRHGIAYFRRVLKDEDGEALIEQGYEVLDSICSEREAQDQKWGAQTHSYLGWGMILLEEVGELFEELLEELGEEAIGDATENPVHIPSLFGYVVGLGKMANGWLKENGLDEPGGAGHGPQVVDLRDEASE